VALPYDMRISCGRSCQRRHNPLFRFVLKRTETPERSSGPFRPVGCMRGLGRAGRGARAMDF
jgi:hypothetical protein